MSTPRNESRIRVGAWIANPALNLLEQGDRSVRLEPRAMDVLMHLATHADTVTSLQELMNSVWKGVVVGDGSVYLAISQLRQALGDADDGVSYIETVPKRGYRLTVPVDTPPPDSARIAARGSRRRWTTSAIVILGVAALAALAWTKRSAEHSLAVLPFADLSPDSDQAYFADGVTAEILDRLALLHDLRVVGRTSSFQLRGQGADSRALGEKLGVDHVLVGSVRKAGERVRITAQLTDTRSGAQLWSQTYERRIADIFAVQDEIASAVAVAMQVKLGVGNTAHIPGMTHDVAAYDEYLQGMALNIVARPESFPPAIAHLQRAIDMDPGFSMAWSALHSVYSNGAFAIPERAAEWRRSADESLEKARQLTPDAPHVLLELGVTAARSGNWLEAADRFQRLEKVYGQQGLAAEGAGPRGVLLLGVGRIGESIQPLESARAHDPLAPAYAGFLAQAYLANRNYRAAFAEIDRGLQLTGLHEALLNSGLSVALNSGDRREIERRLAAVTDDTQAARVHRRLAAFLGNSAGAAAQIRAMAPSANDTEKAALAVWAAYFRESALALDLLSDVAPRRGHPGMIWTPLFSEARTMPGFSELARRMGMVDYWHARGFADFCQPVRDRIQCR